MQAVHCHCRVLTSRLTVSMSGNVLLNEPDETHLCSAPDGGNSNNNKKLDWLFYLCD